MTFFKSFWGSVSLGIALAFAYPPLNYAWEQWATYWDVPGWLVRCAGC